MRSALRRLSVAVVFAMAATGPASAELTASGSKSPMCRDANASVGASVDDLMARMTLEEKVAQMRRIWDEKASVLDAKLELEPRKMAQKYPHGVGQFARPSGATGPVSPRVATCVPSCAWSTRFTVGHTRVGIPMLLHEEGLHGYAAVGATCFPQAIALISSWDPALVRAVNAVTAREIRARCASEALTPVVDVVRDPRWGRIEETFGEDPYLVGEIGVAAVEVLRGGNRKRALQPGKAVPTLKHLTGHGQPESRTNTGRAPYSERTLREFFFPPFEEAIAHTGVSAVMPWYNETDGVPSHANEWLFGNLPRGE